MTCEVHSDLFGHIHRCRFAFGFNDQRQTQKHTNMVLLSCLSCYDSLLIEKDGTGDRGGGFTFVQKVGNNEVEDD